MTTATEFIFFGFLGSIATSLFLLVFEVGRIRRILERNR